MTPEALEKMEKELQPAIAKGLRARSVLNSGAWQQDVEPYLIGHEVDLSRGSSWKPGDSTDTGAVLLGCAFNGGRQSECLNLRNQLMIWDEQGRVAADKLEKARKPK